MNKYLKKFQDISDYPKPKYNYVGYATEDDIVKYYRFQLNCLCFTSLQDGSTISLTHSNSPILYYSLNDIKGDFIQWDYSTITLNNGDKLYMYGDNPTGFNSSITNYSSFKLLGKISVDGDIQCLLSADCPSVIPCDYCFAQLFSGSSGLVKAPQLSAIGLTQYCYANMFNGCTKLTAAPELPATNLSNFCYHYMFSNCTSLTSAPILAASTLAEGCYHSMFVKCIKLETAPTLPAINLVDYCYINMFTNCSSLKYIKAMFTTDIYWSSETYMENWVSGVSSSGTFVKNNAATWKASDVSGVSGIPEGWTVEEASE